MEDNNSTTNRTIQFPSAYVYGSPLNCKVKDYEMFHIYRAELYEFVISISNSLEQFIDYHTFFN